MLTQETLNRVRVLNTMAHKRAQTLRAEHVASTLRDPRVTLSPSGASSVPRLENRIGTLEPPDFSDHEPAAVDAGSNLCKASSDA